MAQMFLIHTCTGMEPTSLLSIAFDCCAAICAPRHSTTMVTAWVLSGIGLGVVLSAVVLTLPKTYLIHHLPFRDACIVAHINWEHMGIVELACDNV